MTEDDLGDIASAAGWAQLGMKPPYTDADLLARKEHIKWVYGYDGNLPGRDGKVYAYRKNVLPSHPGHWKWLGLFSGGIWAGTGAYAPGGQYAPKK